MKSEQVQLEEYRATQEAIIHFERLIWSVGATINAMVAATLGLTARVDQPNSLIVPLIVSGWLYALWYLFELRYRSINVVKYRRLWQIEQELGMRQHLDVRDEDLKRKPRLRGHFLITLICLGFPTTLLALYIVLRIVR